MPKTIWQPTCICVSEWTRKMLFAQKILQMSVDALSWNKFTKLNHPGKNCQEIVGIFNEAF